MKLLAISSEPSRLVRVSGSVRAEGEYPLEPGMSVSDLVRAGGGLAEQAYGGEAELARYEIRDGRTRQTDVLKIDLSRALAGDPAADLLLGPFGVAEAGRRAAGSAAQAVVDAELAAYWHSALQHGQRTMMQGGGALVRTAGLRAAPYLIRREDWATAATLLEDVVHQDQSSATISTVLPLLRRIAQATEGTERGLIDRGVLAKALLAAGRWQDAEAMERQRADEAELVKAWRSASVALGSVVNIMLQTGRAEAALAVVDRMKRATTNAGLRLPCFCPFRE